MIKYLKILTLFVYCIILNAQNPSIQFDHISVEDGLSNNFCYCTMQDDDGFIWFGTESGLNRWDGYDFKIFKNNPLDSTTISNNRILWITKDSDGTLWISTAFGLNKYDKTTESFKQYFFNDTIINKPYLNTIGPISHDNSDILWIGTRTGLIRFNKRTGKYIRFLPNPKNFKSLLSGINTISWIYKESNNLLIIGTADGLLKFNITSSQFEKIIPSEPFQQNERIRPITNVVKPFIDSDGNILVHTIEGGIYKYNLQTQKLKPYSKLHKLTGINISDRILSIISDKSGLIWISTIGKGLFCVDIESNQFTQYLPNHDNQNTISSRWLFNLYQDKNGIIWAATFNKGINKITFPETNVLILNDYSIHPQNPPVGEIMDFCEDDDGFLWTVSMLGGASKLNIRTNEFIPIPSMVSDSSGTSDRRIITVIKDKTGTIWLGMLGLDEYNSEFNTFNHYIHDPKNPNSISNGFILSILEDNSNYLWCGFRGSGLDRFDRKTKKFKHYHYDPNNPNTICNNVVRDLHQDHQNIIWIGTENGLCRLSISDDSTETFKTYKHKLNNLTSISNNFIHSIYEDSQNRLWIGTGKGLNLLNDDANTFTSFPEIESIHSNKIYCIIEDDYSNLWLRTSLGLIRFNPESKKHHIFTEKDGLDDCRTIVFGYHGFEKGNNGLFYYGAVQSLMIFHPDSLKIEAKPGNIILTDLSINYKPLRIGKDALLKQSLSITKKISLNYKQNTISFKFGVLDFITSQKIQYAYKLDNMDEDWIHCGNQRIAHYTSLNPGNYSFYIKAAYNNGDWTKKTELIEIIIKPPWWNNIYAYFIYIIIFFLLLYIILRYDKKRIETEHRAIQAELQTEKIRVDKIIEQENIRRRIAVDLHDEIGSNLSSIALLGDILKQKLNLSDPDKGRLHNIPTIARLTANSISDIIWFINPKNDNFDKLLLKMQDTANIMLDNKEVKFEHTVNILKFNHDIDFHRNIFLIYKEVLNNIITHSQATQVKIEILNDNNHFYLNIEDNGIGFDTKKKYKGNGLKNFSHRINELKGNIIINSEPDMGVQVKLKVKIP